MNELVGLEEQKARRAISKIQRKIQDYINNKQSTNSSSNNNNNEASKEINPDKDPELENLQNRLKKCEEDLLYIMVIQDENELFNIN
jgi:ribosome recycling factor